MLQLLILGGKALTLVVWAAGIWAWVTGVDTFFGQMMRILLLLTVVGHFLMALGFYLWGRSKGLASPANVLLVLVFGMFQVCGVMYRHNFSPEDKNR